MDDIQVCYSRSKPNWSPDASPRSEAEAVEQRFYFHPKGRVSAWFINCCFFVVKGGGFRVVNLGRLLFIDLLSCLAQSFFVSLGVFRVLVFLGFRVEGPGFRPRCRGEGRESGVSRFRFGV